MSDGVGGHFGRERAGTMGCIRQTKIDAEQRAAVLHAGHPGVQAIGRGGIALQENVLGPDRQGDAAAGGQAAAAVFAADAQPGIADAVKPVVDLGGALDEIHRADEIGHKGGSRLVVDLVGGAVLGQTALLDDQNAVGHGQGLFLIVGDHDRGNAQALLKLADFAAQLLPHLGVQGGEGLVQQQKIRCNGDGARQCDPLLLAAGQLGGVLPAHAAQPDQVQQFIHVGIYRRSGLSLALEAIGDVLTGGQVGEKGVGLEDNADLAA
ncbi:hypothetical protein DESC_460120 [Desulfosarcina cetonica]|nr:hypothetical protein DESC_460120 [Desulfosarcina cetonica]